MASLIRPLQITRVPFAEQSSPRSRDEPVVALVGRHCRRGHLCAAVRIASAISAHNVVGLGADEF